MDHFHYQDNELYCENVRIKDIAKAVGTPFYLYSHATLKRHFEVFNQAFEGVWHLTCFSAKANTNLAVLTLFANLGGGLDIVSGGEMFRGLAAGFTADRIVYSGVGKRIDEIDAALETGILMFNVESLQELEVLNSRAALLKKKAPVAMRVNPNVDPETHPYISTGLKKNKFGIDSKIAIKAYQMAAEMKNIDVIGIDCHIGSQITQIDPFQAALKSLLALIRELGETGIHIRYLDMGGGLGITYGDEAPPEPGEYARAIVAATKGTDLRLILEPGRVIAGNAGILVTEVQYRKSAPEKEFIITDAAMNDLLRPSLYKAYHTIAPVEKTGAKEMVADIVGPVCESGDFLALERRIPVVERGDLLAVFSAGAYGYVMSSNYCSRLKLAEVMVRGQSFDVVRERQTYDDLIRGETVPAYLKKPE